jgi:hypothetical protein
LFRTANHSCQVSASLAGQFMNVEPRTLHVAALAL